MEISQALQCSVAQLSPSLAHQSEISTALDTCSQTHYSECHIYYLVKCSQSYDFMTTYDICISFQASTGAQNQTHNNT